MKLKKVLAAVLTTSILLTSALSVGAEAPESPGSGKQVGSPEQGIIVTPTPTPVPSAQPTVNTQPTAAPAVTTVTDNNSKDYKKATVVSVVSSSSATVKSASATKKKASLTLKTARNSNDEQVAITTIGDGKSGVFNSKKGKNVKKLTIKSSKKVTIKKNAFKGSKVSTLNIAGKKVQINKNSFKGTKAKSLTLKVKKAKLLKLKKGAFKGLDSIKIKGANKKEKAELIKAIKKAGFKGTIK